MKLKKPKYRDKLGRFRAPTAEEFLIWWNFVFRWRQLERMTIMTWREE